ncbi:toll/interleukin-1 receptor domain-containing protein [Vibrio splendidus]
MALLKKSDLNSNIHKSKLSCESYLGKSKTFDVFLSHSFADQETVLGIKEYLESKSLSVYIDWIDDNQLDRGEVNEDTADLLRKRMKLSRCLIFATSSNSTSSKWMPWECGYFDGIKGKVAILPVVDADTYRYEGQEYLGLYPYIDISSDILWVNSPSGGFCRLEEWLDGKSPKS